MTAPRRRKPKTEVILPVSGEVVEIELLVEEVDVSGNEETDTPWTLKDRPPRRRKKAPEPVAVKRNDLTIDAMQQGVIDAAAKIKYIQHTATVGITSKLATIAEIYEAWRFYRSEVTPEAKQFASDTLGQLLFHLGLFASDMGINLQDAFTNACPDSLPRRIPFGKFQHHMQNASALRQYSDNGGRPGEEERLSAKECREPFDMESKQNTKINTEIDKYEGKTKRRRRRSKASV